MRSRRPQRHRSRRERVARTGLLLQVDGSRHDWLEGRGPLLTLVGAIDDATGLVIGATFRAQEDAAGDLDVLSQTVHRHGTHWPPTADPRGEREPARRHPNPATTSRTAAWMGVPSALEPGT